MYFVFLNRIFDTFVSGPEEYDALVDDKKRLKFIEAICQDCQVNIKEAQAEKAILYIHDKEWYKSDETFTVLLNGNVVYDENKDSTYVNELEKYFSTIKIFQHIPHPIFNEIKELDFTEEDENVITLERRYW